jgi:transposase
LVIGKCYKRHRAAEFLNFLKEIDAHVPEGLEVHIVMDNYATHKTPKIKAWLTRRPYYHVHFMPTSASWINQVECWFTELTRKRLRRGVHTSVRQLEADIRIFIDRHNDNPEPFKWVKSADQVLALVKRFCQKTQQTLCCELQIHVIHIPDVCAIARATGRGSRGYSQGITRERGAAPIRQGLGVSAPTPHGGKFPHLEQRSRQSFLSASQATFP